MGAAFTAKQWSDVPEAGGAARCWELLSPVLWPQPCPELPGFPAGLWLGSPADGTVGAVLPPAPTQTPWQGLCWRLPPLFRASLDSPPRAPQQAGARGCLRPQGWGPWGFPHTMTVPHGVCRARGQLWQGSRQRVQQHACQGLGTRVLLRDPLGPRQRQRGGSQGGRAGGQGDVPAGRLHHRATCSGSGNPSCAAGWVLPRGDDTAALVSVPPG